MSDEKAGASRDALQALLIDDERDQLVSLKDHFIGKRLWDTAAEQMRERCAHDMATLLRSMGFSEVRIEIVIERIRNLPLRGKDE